MALFSDSCVRDHPIQIGSWEEQYKVKDFYRQEGEGARRLHWKKKRLVITSLLSFRGWQADYLTSGTVQVIPD